MIVTSAYGVFAKEAHQILKKGFFISLISSLVLSLFYALLENGSLTLRPPEICWEEIGQPPSLSGRW